MPEGRKQFNSRGWRMDGAFDEDYRKYMGYVPRQSVRYNPSEDIDIFTQLAEGFNIVEIAEYHERTANGIDCHLRRLYETYPQGVSYECFASGAFDYRSLCTSKGYSSTYHKRTNNFWAENLEEGLEERAYQQERSILVCRGVYP